MITLRVILCFFIIIVGINVTLAEEILVKKITLAKFRVIDNKIADLPEFSPYWPRVDRHILTVDDKDEIYILNLWNNEILLYNERGKVIKKIPLPGKPYKSTVFEPLAGEGYLEVSGNGGRIFVDIPLHKSYILDKNGKIIKQFSKEETIPSFPDVRLCNNTYVSKGQLIYDENFKTIGENLPIFLDSEGKYQVKAREHLLIKQTKNGKKLWEKQFDGYFEVIGVDGNNYLYLRGELKKGDPSSLYKLNSKGEIIASISIPDPFPFLTQKEKEEWSITSSEDFLSFYKLSCKGEVYLIYQLKELPTLTFNRWLKGGEYFIYKFETKK